MKYLLFGAVVAFGLAACDTVPTVAPPTPQTTPVVAAPEPVDAPMGARASARAFVDVVTQLEPVAEAECRRRAAHLNCDFTIVVDYRPDQPANAFQTVDDVGRPIIGFTLALIADARNRDEIAFVMAHEVAHHIEDHLSQKQRNAVIGAVVFGQWASQYGVADDVLRSAQEMGAALGVLTYSKDFELEADRLGTIIAARAGFDPVRGAEYFFRIPDPGDVFLGTHPPNAARVQAVRDTAAGL